MGSRQSTPSKSLFDRATTPIEGLPSITDEKSSIAESAYVGIVRQTLHYCLRIMDQCDRSKTFVFSVLKVTLYQVVKVFTCQYLTLYHTIWSFNNLTEKTFGNIVRKGENAGSLHFLPFRQCFLSFPNQILIIYFVFYQNFQI